MKISSGDMGASESQDMQQSAKESQMSQASSSGQEQASSDIAKLAYVLWEQRGCPVGSPEQDWIEAEQRMREMTMQSGSARS